MASTGSGSAASTFRSGAVANVAMRRNASLNSSGSNGGAGGIGVNSNGSNNNNGVQVERRCENDDCNVNNLLEGVAKRKTSQFVSKPSITEQPMLIRGYTTIFQVDGTSGKLGDVKDPGTISTFEPKTIYRIVPDTHAHIMNYVVIDGNDSLRRINENDPVTITRLLDSQRSSAEQMLDKLMGIAGAAASNALAAKGMTIGKAITANKTNLNSSAPPTLTTYPSAVSTPTVIAAAATNTSTSAIQFPRRMHPNLKITAVTSAENMSSLPVSNAAAAPTASAPLITAVPLATLQKIPTLKPLTAPAAAMDAAAISKETAEKLAVDKMQLELQELRRTVALLAEAQAKSQLQQQPPMQQPTMQQLPTSSQLSTDSRAIKRTFTGIKKI